MAVEALTRLALVYDFFIALNCATAERLFATFACLLHKEARIAGDLLLAFASFHTTACVKRVVLMPEARKTLSRLPLPTAERILDKIELYAREPQALAKNIKRLKGDQGFRLRVGDWRVLFDEDADTVTVRGVRPRGSAYR